MCHYAFTFGSREGRLEQRKGAPRHEIQLQLLGQLAAAQLCNETEIITLVCYGIIRYLVVIFSKSCPYVHLVYTQELQTVRGLLRRDRP
jgi:hypothetical protein